MRVDDGFYKHSKVRGLTDRAFRLHLVGLSVCAHDLTDGYLGTKDVKLLTIEVGATRRHVDELVDAALWLPAHGGFQINDFLDYNPPAEQVKRERRELSEKRRAAGRKGAEKRWQTDGKPDGKRHGNADPVLPIAPSPPVFKTKSKDLDAPPRNPVRIDFAARATQALAVRQALDDA